MLRLRASQPRAHLASCFVRTTREDHGKDLLALQANQRRFIAITVRIARLWWEIKGGTMGWNILAHYSDCGPRTFLIGCTPTTPATHTEECRWCEIMWRYESRSPIQGRGLGKPSSVSHSRGFVDCSLLYNRLRLRVYKWIQSLIKNSERRAS